LLAFLTTLARTTLLLLGLALIYLLPSKEEALQPT
jgi:hypothetical protein